MYSDILVLKCHEHLIIWLLPSERGCNYSISGVVTHNRVPICRQLKHCHLAAIVRHQKSLCAEPNIDWLVDSTLVVQVDNTQEPILLYHRMSLTELPGLGGVMKSLP